jgi:selenocysteine-specific elongation factor
VAGEQINLTLGTAGHVDHGKTALIKCLTGCETDRLREEKERGLSIELGFAPCTLGEVEVGIVDVPGHEHFVKTMVAGATGIDAVLFVVAADDGIMPQTREHLDILTLLGVEAGLVALTKIDRVPDQRVDAVRSDLERFLAGTFLEGAPILAVSSVTGAGFDAFLKALKELVARLPPRRAEGVFRLPVERTFSVKGHGTVVTGIPVSGRAAVGDEVELLPAGEDGRIRAVEVYGRAADRAAAGQCAALQVPRWDAAAVSRGDVVATPGYFAPQTWYVCRLRVLPHETTAVKNASEVRFHTGTSEVTAKVYLMEGDVLRAGEEGLVQVRLAEAVVAGPGDPFIVRSLSPVVTVGGGTIVEAVSGRLKRTRPEVVADLRERADAVRNDRRFLAYCLRTAEAFAAGEEELARRTKHPPERVRAALDELHAAGDAAEIAPRRWLHTDTARALGDRLIRTVAQHHEAEPDSPGIAPDELLEASGLKRDVFDAARETLEEAGELVERHNRLALPAHEPAVSPAEREAMQRVEAAFLEAPFRPPRPDQVAEKTGLDSPAAREAVRRLLERERLVRVAPDLLFHRDAIERAREALVDYLRREGSLESVKFKYLLETTRKYAIPLLDYFDSVGVTRKTPSHTRYLRE